MTQCKIAVSPLLRHWRFHSPTLSHLDGIFQMADEILLDLLSAAQFPGFLLSCLSVSLITLPSTHGRACMMSLPLLPPLKMEMESEPISELLSLRALDGSEHASADGTDLTSGVMGLSGGLGMSGVEESSFLLLEVSTGSVDNSFASESEKTRYNKAFREDDTPQPLVQLMDSPFMGQQVGNWKFHTDPLLGQCICHAWGPRASPLCIQHRIQLTSRSFQANRPSHS